MGIPVLLVSTATQWLGTARIPRALAHAGFDVALLAPRDALAEKSAFVDRIGHLPDDATPLQWLHAFAAMVKTTSPRLVLPCDDMAFRLMQSLVQSPPQDLDPALHLQLAALIRDSLGDPAWYRASVDKTLLPEAAEALGVRVPAYAMMSAPEEGEAFAAAHGYPVAVKRSHGFAGHGVALCADAGAIARAYADLTRPDAFDDDGRDARRLLVQAHIPGRALLYSVAAWRGSVRAGWASEKLVVNPHPTGPATVLRLHRSPDVRSFAETLAEGFGMSGIFDLECMIHRQTGAAYLIEINRRITPGSHCGSAHGVDLCAALFAAVNGTASPSRADLDPGEERIAVHFPQEWLRDPDSRYLRDHPVDVPWDEPELFEALLALRSER